MGSNPTLTADGSVGFDSAKEGRVLHTNPTLTAGENMPTANENQTTQEARPVKQEPERDLAVWTAPARPFKRRDRQFYTTLMAIAAIVGLILFLVEGVMPVILLISIIFLFYIMSTVEPEKIEYKITTRGIKIAGRTTEWSSTSRFWFSKRFDSNLLVIETFFLPGRLELIINPEDKEQIRKAIVTYIPEEETPPSSLDRAANWFAQKLPQS